jgi:hypothetical protein
MTSCSINSSGISKITEKIKQHVVFRAEICLRLPSDQEKKAAQFKNYHNFTTWNLSQGHNQIY